MIIPIPKYTEVEISPNTKTIEWYRWYLGCPNWVCSKCQTTNFGRNKLCARCKDARPSTYVEDVYEAEQRD